MTQPALDFTVAAADIMSEAHARKIADDMLARHAAPLTVYAQHTSELAHEAARLDSSKARILARLREGPASNVELNAIAFRFGGRIHELRAEGYRIVTEHGLGGRCTYTLTGGGA